MAQDWLDTPLNLSGKKIWITGHKGMVGSALMRALEKENAHLMTYEGDLRNQAETLRWMYKEKPEIIIMAAAKVGGIMANASRPAEFLYDNMMIEANVIHSAHLIGVEKLLFLGSSCIYPKDAPQPITENSLLTGPLEITNEPYAIAKIAGIKLCETYREQYGDNFISAMPCNLYGPGDKFDLINSHVIPALMMRMHEAKTEGHPEMEIWGTGAPMREFLYIDDLAGGLIALLKSYQGSQHINIGSGQETSIYDLAHLMADIIDYKGKLSFDKTKPDGTPRKIMDSSAIEKTGWKATTDLATGLKTTYDYFCDKYTNTAAA